MFKKKSWAKRIAALCVMTTCIGGVRSTPAQAQNEGISNRVEWRSIRVRNVRPSMLAWRLDPKNNPEPAEIRLTRSLDAGPLMHPNIFDVGGDSKAYATFKLDGIQVIHAVDVQNTIFALADAASWKKFQSIVEFLDKPIPQIEISLTQVEISENDAVPAGWWKRDGKLSDILKMPTSKYEETLQALQKTGRIKIINSPRVTTMNNLPASLGSADLQPAKVTLDTGVAPAIGHDYSTVIYPSTQFMMKREWRVTATPTVNNDGSITLSLNLAEPLCLVRGSMEEFRQSVRNYQNPHTERQALPELLLEKGDKLTSVINLKSDETILVADHNYSTQGATAGDGTPDKNPFHRLIFVSARRIDTNQ